MISERGSGLMRRISMSLLALHLLSNLAIGSAATAQVIDTFNGSNDDDWTHFIATLPFPTFSVSGGQYTITAPATNDAFDPARAGSQREGVGETFTDVVVAVDLAAWNDAEANQIYTLVARATSDPSQGSGYGLSYNTGGGSELRLLQINSEIPVPLSLSSISLDPNECHRLALRITGSSPASLTGRVALCSDPGTALVSLSHNDSIATIYTTGVTGLAVADGSGVGTGSPSATFDNFFADSPTGDADSDGLTNEAELITHGTDPTNDDTDGDGLLDGAEVNTHGSDPLDTDTDDDGLFDGSEVVSFGTDPNDADTDDDELSDFFELSFEFYGLDPLDPDSNTNGVIDGRDDSDSDGLGNAAESAFGTHFLLRDDDLDGLLDGAEVGSGTFGPQQIISTLADSAVAVVAADLDGDGDLDAVSASSNDDEIAWYENTDGLGTFGAQQVVTNLADSATAVAAADLDGDGDLDLVSTSSNDDKLAWYENTDGAGTFGAQQIISTAADGPRTLAAADLDGDGDPDLLVGSFAGIPTEVSWFENTDGQATFGAKQTITTLASSPTSVVAGDLDGDGDLDVLACSFTDNEIAWYANTNGAGSFGAQQIIASGTTAVFPTSVIATDVDGDGDMDVVSTSRNDDKLAWYENTNGLGSFGSQQVVSTAGNGANSVSAGDIDLDGDFDLAQGSSFDDEISWYANTNGGGSFGVQQIVSNLADQAVRVVLADLDGDGDLDILSSSSNDDEISWYEQLNVSDPLDPDSDDDNLLDGFEVTYGLDPLDADQNSNATLDGQDDFDGDNLTNEQEQAAETNPNLADTDGDGFDDGFEVSNGYDPNDPNSFPMPNVPSMGPVGLAGLVLTLLGASRLVWRRTR